MAIKVLREEIIIAAGGEQFEVETRGELHLLPRTAQSAFAIFGTFERTQDGTLFYSTGSEGEDIDSLDSMYLDDLRALKRGNFEIVDRRTQ